jgi:hypothetical protein
MENTEDRDRLDRAARNQSLFREVNERLEAIAETFQDAAQTTFVCECAELGCTEQVALSMDEYEAVRNDPNNFAVLPGHVYADVERVVRENERFVVVAKLHEAAVIATELDPRSAV